MNELRDLSSAEYFLQYLVPPPVGARQACFEGAREDALPHLPQISTSSVPPSWTLVNSTKKFRHSYVDHIACSVEK